MRQRRLSSLLGLAASALLPGLAYADDPSPAGAAKPAAAAPGDIAPVGEGQPGTRPSGSKTIGGADKDPGARRIQSTVDGLSAPGSLFGADQGTSAAESKDTIEPARTGQVPELHVVQKGETLWSLCSKYYGDPWRWPRLWADNPIVTNPHWIFPGDVLKLSDGSGRAPAPAPSPPSGPPRPGLTAVNRAPATSESSFLLRELGFIEAKDLDQAATVSGSREEKIMLATGDQAYLRYPKSTPVRAGNRYSVFETDLDHPVVDATTGKTYGYLVHILGDLVVNQIADNDVARGTLFDTVKPIERGARVSGFVRQFKRVEPRASDVNLEARVIATFVPNTLLGAGHFVVLNRGSRDGVQVGNRTFVIRQGDGYRGTLESWEVHDPTSPKEVVGEILVVDVRENASVAWIARSNKELKVGEITEMRKGH